MTSATRPLSTVPIEGRSHVLGVSRTARSRRAVAGVTLGACVFLAGIFGAPLLQHGHPTAATILRAIYAPICHQLPARSLEIAGAPLAVCARCTGLYLGGVLGLLAGLLLCAWCRGVRRWVIGAAVAPTICDALLPWIGLSGLANDPRFLLAIPAGVACGWLLAIGVGDIVSCSESSH